MEIAEHQDFPVTNGQGRDARSNLPDALRLDHLRADVPGGHPLGRGIELHPPSLAPEAVTHQVACHAIQIGGQRRSRRIVSAKISHQRQKHILDNVVGDLRRAGHRPGKAVDDSLMPAVDGGKRLSLSLPCPFHQLPVGGLGDPVNRHLSMIARTGLKVPDFLAGRLFVELSHRFRQPCVTNL